MLITCWSSKGGSGTTVVAAALATVLAAEAGAALLVDLGGDQPAALGLPEPPVGLGDWSAVAHGSRPPDLLSFAVDAGAGVRLLPRGPGPVEARVGPALAAALVGSGSAVVDAGVVDRGDSPSLDLAAAATFSLLVLRPCFLALRRAVAAPLRASGVVLVDEAHRVLGAGDIEAALGIPVVAVIPWDPAVARRVDAGLLGSAVPRTLTRPLQRLVATPAGPPVVAPARTRPEAVA